MLVSSTDTSYTGQSLQSIKRIMLNHTFAKTTSSQLLDFALKSTSGSVGHYTLYTSKQILFCWLEWRVIDCITIDCPYVELTTIELQHKGACDLHYSWLSSNVAPAAKWNVHTLSDCTSVCHHWEYPKSFGSHGMTVSVVLQVLRVLVFA